MNSTHSEDGFYDYAGIRYRFGEMGEYSITNALEGALMLWGVNTFIK